ncbi:hypothetical protein GPK34_10470, partial [Secundilactobacillus kimchicus]|uniref:mucin-binding protein n=1 Tax=Secundilactobacillus kimchicus TaxID=528209 RepID=UPI001C032D4F
MSKRIKKAHNKLVADSMDKKEHYKLYKSGKRWLIAGVMVASFAGSFFGIDQVKDAQAATTDASSTEQATTSQQIQQPSVTLNQTPTTSAAPASSAPASAASVDSNSTQSSAPASSTDTQSSSSSEAAQPAVDEASQASSTASEATQPATDKTSQASSSASKTAQPVKDETLQSSNASSAATQTTTDETSQASSATSEAAPLTKDKDSQASSAATPVEGANLTSTLGLDDATATVRNGELLVVSRTGKDVSVADVAAAEAYAAKNNLQILYGKADGVAAEPVMPTSANGITWTDLKDGNWEQTADDPSDLTNVTRWFQISAMTGSNGGVGTDDLAPAGTGVFLSHAEYDSHTGDLTKVYPDTKVVVLMLKDEPFTRFYLGVKAFVQANNNTFKQDANGDLIQDAKGAFVPKSDSELKPFTTIQAGAALAGGSDVYGYELNADETTAFIRALAYSAKNSLDSKTQEDTGLPAGVYMTTFGFTDSKTGIRYKVKADKITATSVEFAASAKVQIKYVDADGHPTDKDGNPIKDGDEESSIAYETEVPVTGGVLNNEDLDTVSAKIDPTKNSDGSYVMTDGNYLDDSQDSLAKADVNVSDALSAALQGDGTNTYTLVKHTATLEDSTNKKEGFYNISDSGTAQIALDYKTARALTETPTLVYTIQVTKNGQAQVTYVDDDNKQADVTKAITGADPQELAGSTGDEVKYTVATADQLKTAGYVIVDEKTYQPGAENSVTLTDDDKDNVAIHVKHLITNETPSEDSLQTTRQIVFDKTGLSESDKNDDTLTDKTQTVYWAATTDEATQIVTGYTPYTKDASGNFVKADGYPTYSFNTPKAHTASAVDASGDVVDVTTGSVPLGAVEAVTNASDTTKSATKPTNAEKITVKFINGGKTVTPDNNPDNLDLTKTVTETITYGPEATDTTTDDSNFVTFYRTALVDGTKKATDDGYVLSYGAWTTDETGDTAKGSAEGHFAALTNDQLRTPDHYTATVATKIGTTATGANDDITVHATDGNVTRNVTYTKDAPKVYTPTDNPNGLDLTKTVTEKIVYQDDKGQEIDTPDNNVQSIDFYRTATETGDKDTPYTYSDWTTSPSGVSEKNDDGSDDTKATIDKIPTYILNSQKGYVYDKGTTSVDGGEATDGVGDVEVSGDVKEVVRTLVYTKDDSTATTDGKDVTVTRTIHYVDDQGNKVADDLVQTITLGTKVLVDDPDTIVSYTVKASDEDGNGTADDTLQKIFTSVDSPDKEGYTADNIKVDDQNVPLDLDGQPQNLETTVNYTKAPDSAQVHEITTDGTGDEAGTHTVIFYTGDEVDDVSKIPAGNTIGTVTLKDGDQGPQGEPGQTPSVKEENGKIIFFIPGKDGSDDTKIGEIDAPADGDTISSERVDKTDKDGVSGIKVTVKHGDGSDDTVTYLYDGQDGATPTLKEIKDKDGNVTGYTIVIDGKDAGTISNGKDGATPELT